MNDPASKVPAFAGELEPSRVVTVERGVDPRDLALVAFEYLVMPSPTRHHELAVHAIRRGPFAKLFWGGAIATAAVSAIVGALWSGMPAAVALAAGLALAGSFAWEYIWVEAGQSVPLS